MDRPTPQALRKSGQTWTTAACAILALAAVACEGEIELGEPSGQRVGANDTSGPVGGGVGLPSPDPEDFPDGSPVPRGLSLVGDPAYTRFARLTNEQWGNAVSDLLSITGTDLTGEFEQPVLGATDFDNNEHGLLVTHNQWQAYQSAAEEAAKRATASSAQLAEIYRGTDRAGFIEDFGRRAFRRPLSSAEARRYSTLFSAGEALPGAASAFQKGAGLVIQAMLQSPYFLYRTERGAEGQPLNGFELATKLSFWLLRTTPPDSLLDDAQSGALDTADGLAAAARELLDDPRALTTMRDFYGQLFDFARYRTISKLGVSDYDEALNAELEEASYLFFERIFAEDLGVDAILTEQTGFVGPRMAEIYGLSAPRRGMEARELGPERAGYFTQLPFLTLHAFNEEPDSIHRGVALNLDVLCADPGTALPNLPPVPELKPGQSNRERISELTSGCGGECHNSYINPLGFALESFDGMGRLRDTDNGKPVDTTGVYPLLEGLVTYDGAEELMAQVADGLQAHACHAKKIASYGLGRDIVRADEPMLRALAEVSLAGGSIKDVMVALVRQPAFRQRTGG